MHLTSNGAVANHGGMKIVLAILFALSACGDDIATHPDASQPAADAAIDAGYPVDRGCMGNLPTSRTVTINPGDPIPPALLNEVQDQIIGNKRAAYTTSFLPGCIGHNGVGGAVATLVVNPLGGTINNVWRITPGVGSIYRIDIPFVVGEQITALSIDLYGAAATEDVAMSVGLYSTPGLVGSGIDVLPATFVNNIPTAWTRYSLDQPFLAQTLAVRNMLVLSISAQTGTNVFLAAVSPTFRKL